MPNRIIKESITTSETLAKLTGDEERHFWRLIVQADDYGYLDARPEVIRAKGYAMLLDAVSAFASEDHTLGLVRVGLLHLFTVDGKRYGHFPTWAKHQRVRASLHRYPTVESCDSECNQMPANGRNSPQLAATRRLNPNPNPNPNPSPLSTESSKPLASDLQQAEKEIFPNSCQGWQELIGKAETQQAQVKVLVDMVTHHFAHPPLKPGDSAVALLKQVRDPPYAVKLLWDAMGANPVGNVFHYAAGIYGKRNGTGQKIDPRRAHERGSSTGRPWEVVGASGQDDGGEQAM